MHANQQFTAWFLSYAHFAPKIIGEKYSSRIFHHMLYGSVLRALAHGFQGP